MVEPIAHNVIHTASITDFDDQGRGVCHVDGRVVFCRGGVPGDKVALRIVKEKTAWAGAEMTELLTPSPHRVSPFCPHFPRCGGCSVQQYDYAAGLRWKQGFIAEKLRRIGGLDNCEVLPVLGMDHPMACRGKSAFPFALSSEGLPVPGLFERGSHRLLPINACPMQHPAADGVLFAVGQWALAHKPSVYNEETGQGLLRHLLIRTAFGTGEIMVILVTSGEIPPHIDSLIPLLHKALEAHEGFSLASLYVNFQKQKNNVILGGTSRLLYGSPTITERLGGLDYSLSPLSFFQVNPLQAERLYDILRKESGLQAHETALDLYCGIGGIALTLAPLARRVVGVETVSQAVENAADNAERNGLSHKVQFLRDKAERFLPHYTKNHGEAALAVLDPPRKGCDPALLDTLCRHGPERLIYVSCNPATLARDLRQLQNHYHPGKVQPVDMFPWTSHVECLVSLSRIKSEKGCRQYTLGGE